jgi:DNA-binding transcriptional LysR family regulator
MRLSYIPTFAAVCRGGTFSRAAEKLHISQPAVSKAIKELEQDCGVALFERQHSTISLTPEGRKLWEGCQRWLKESEELEKLGTSLKTGRQILRIGVVPMCGNTIFPQLHQQFLARHPDYQIRTVEDTASVLYGLLDRQELDLILCVTNHLPLAPYHCKVIKKSRLELFVARTHPLARKKFLSFQDLAGVPLVLFPDTFGQTRYIRRLFAQAQTDPQVLHQTGIHHPVLHPVRSRRRLPAGRIRPDRKRAGRRPPGRGAGSQHQSGMAPGYPDPSGDRRVCERVLHVMCNTPAS